MTIFLHRDFKKRYRQLRHNEQEKFKERRDLFLKNPFDPILNNHHLKGKYQGCRSINIDGDLRVIYRLIEKDIALFITLGTHDELYS